MKKFKQEMEAFMKAIKTEITRRDQEAKAKPPEWLYTEEGEIFADTTDDLETLLDDLEKHYKGLF